MTPLRGALLTVLLVLAALVSLEARDPGHFQTDDNVTYLLPYYVHNLRTLRETGELAVVNWHQYQGQPHFAHAVSGTAEPLNYAATWIATVMMNDPPWAMDLLVLVQLVAGAAILFWALVERGCAPALAVAAATAAGTLPWFVGVSRVWAAAPVIFLHLAVSIWCLGRARERGPRGWAALGWLALDRGWFLLHGNVQFVVFAALFDGALLALDLAARGRGAGRAAVTWALAHGIGGLIALPLLVENVPAVQASFRAAALSSDRAGAMAVSWSSLLGAQVGRFPPLAMDFDAHVALIAALDALAVGAVAVAWRMARRSGPPVPAGAEAAWPWLAVAVLAALATTNWLPVFSIPGLDRFRWPFKFLPFLGWFVTVGTALLFSRWHRAGWLPLRLATALLATAAGAQLAVLHLPSSLQSFAQRRLDPEDLALARALPPGSGRLAAVGPADIRLSTPFNYNFATLTGHFAFAGSDQLISREQRTRALGAALDNFIPGTFSAVMAERLERLGVRYLIAARDAGTEAALGAMPSLVLRLVSPRWTVWELPSPWPLAWIERDDSPGGREPCAVAARGNCLTAQVPPGAAGRLWINAFPLRGLVCRRENGPWRGDAEVLVPPGGLDPMPSLRVPANAGAVEWSVELPRLRWTTPVAVLTALGCVGLAWSSRHRAPAPEGLPS